MNVNQKTMSYTGLAVSRIIGRDALPSTAYFHSFIGKMPTALIHAPIPFSPFMMELNRISLFIFGLDLTCHYIALHPHPFRSFARGNY